MDVLALFGLILTLFGTLIELLSISGGVKSDANLAIAKRGYNIDIAVERARKRADTLFAATLIVIGLLLTSIYTINFVFSIQEWLLLGVAIVSLMYFIIMCLLLLRRSFIRKTVVVLFKDYYTDNNQQNGMLHDIEYNLPKIKIAMDSVSITANQFFEYTKDIK